jgi:hypothetical protein
MHHQDAVSEGERVSKVRFDGPADITHSVVFVIAPTDVAVQVRAADAPVLRFESAAEFERWRKGSNALVDAAVHAALAELNVAIPECSSRTQEVITRLRERETIPSVKELLAPCSSRRSFYRSWSEDVGETPAAFLDRVRLLHLRTSGENRAAHLGTPDEQNVVR